MRTKQVRPPKLEYEFEIILSKAIDKITNQEYISFIIRTVKVFENFRYKIDVTEKIDTEKKKISFRIEGLSAPSLTLAKSGPATYEYKLYDFKNTEYELNISKERSGTNTFKFKVNKQKIKLAAEPRKKFIKLIVK
ncbi:MAG: hypothetical protein ACP5P3_04955 [Ignavibacteria bacterium]